jgi:RNA polymerase sigma-70 factor (ECF subfamily)
MMALPHDEFVALLTASQKRLYAFVSTLVVDRSDAEDVLQETNMALWAMADRFEPGTDFLAWACRVAHLRVLRQRTAAKRLRIRMSQPLMEMLASEMLDESRLDSLVHEEQFERRRVALASCLDELSERNRTLLLEHYDGGRSLCDLGATLGRNRKAMAQLFLRIRSALRSCIQRRLGFGAP